MCDNFLLSVYGKKDQAQLPAFSFNTITAKVLAKKLKELEQHKLLKRLIIDDYPVKIYHINWKPK
ncbi:winged helix-turn-helix transcriptional regulator [Terrimonas pollutisoli]|uniref:winged helix-turn-helix transcriptional regulator n=1 Tax=Terrimonas pollutisoli TaxID=3034147 RepID=UPI0034DF52DA